MKRKIYFTADWHVGHANCLKFDNRPFDTIEEMHEALVKNFNCTVPKHGITYFAGDMGWTSHGLLRSIITRLNGTKILVRGNHDGGLDAMYEAGFDFVTEKAQFTLGKEIVTITHCPLKGVFREDTTGMRGHDGTENWHGEEKNGNRYSIEDFGQFHLHGHVHTRPDRGLTKDGRQWDVGVPGNNYKPVTMSQVQSWITKYKETHAK
jgi:calcineurin-like phosphoesterase family protein